MECTRIFEKKNQPNVHNSVTKNGGTIIFLCATYCPDLIYILVKLHEDILNCYLVIKYSRIFGKNQIRGHNSETKKGRAIILLRDTSS